MQSLSPAYRLSIRVCKKLQAFSLHQSSQTGIFSTGQAFNPEVARLDEPASSFADFLQSQLGKQQITAGAGSVINLPLQVSFMGCLGMDISCL